MPKPRNPNRKPSPPLRLVRQRKIQDFLRPSILHRVPLEILFLVTSKLSQTDIQRLCLSSKVLYGRLLTEVYKNVTFDSTHPRHEDLKRESFDRSSFAQDASEKLNILNYIKKLEVIRGAESLSNFSHNCKGHYGFGNETAIFHENIERVSQTTRDAFSEIEENSLQSLNWHLSCLQPDTVFGEFGWIAEKQKHITALSLRKGYQLSDVDYAGLTKLVHLRHFSWQGPGTANKCSDSLIKILLANSRTLESLAIRFLAFAPCEAYEPGKLGDQIAASDSNEFHSLRHLTFANLLMEPQHLDDGECFFDRFPLGQLETLRLLNCSTVLFCFQAEVDAGRVKSLKAFEFSRPELILSEADQDAAADAVAFQAHEAHQLMDAVVTFDGLEELYIAFTDPIAGVTSLQIEAIMAHRKTLKRFVFHNYQDHCISPDVVEDWLSWIEDLLHAFYHTQLECVGVSIPPSELRLVAETISNVQHRKGQTFKLLHVRVTGKHHTPRNLLVDLCRAGLPKDHYPARVQNQLKEIKGKEKQTGGEAPHKCRSERLLDMADFLSFAQWAFSSKGFPNLTILALGDFTDDKHEWSQVLLCRYPRAGPSARRPVRCASTYNFRVMGPKDEDLWDEIDKSKEVLRACTVDGLHPENVLDEMDGDSDFYEDMVDMDDMDPDGISD